MFKAVKMYNSAGMPLEEVYQWDVHRVVMIPDVSIQADHSYFIHFASCKSGVAYAVEPEIEDDVGIYDGSGVEPTEKDGVLVAVIPSQLMYTPHVIRVYVYEDDDNTGERKTIGMALLPVVAKCEPSGEDYDVSGDVISVANGLVVDDGKLYLSRDGNKFGEGVNVGGGGGGTPAEVVTISAENSTLSGADIYGTSNAVYPEMTEGHSIKFVQGEWNYSNGIGGPLYVETGNIGKTVMSTTPYILKAGKKYTISCATQYMWMRGIFVDGSLRVTENLGWQTMPTVINGASWSEDKALILSIANERWNQNPTGVANATTVSIE